MLKYAVCYRMYYEIFKYQKDYLKLDKAFVHFLFLICQETSVF